MLLTATEVAESCADSNAAQAAVFCEIVFHPYILLKALLDGLECILKMKWEITGIILAVHMKTQKPVSRYFKTLLKKRNNIYIIYNIIIYIIYII